MRERRFDTAIIGGGSAATGFAAAVERKSSGALKRYANELGLAVVAPDLGAGVLAEYGINGNSQAKDFISGTPSTGLFEFVRRGQRAQYLELADSPVSLGKAVAPF